MKFYVWANSEDKRTTPIRDTAGQHNLELEFICNNVKFDQGCLFKFPSLYEKLCDLDDNEIVCCTDGFDVVYQDNLESIKNTFLSFNCDVVFSAEKLYSHQLEKNKEYFESLTKSSYKYLNAGSVIGYAKSLKEIYGPKSPKMSRVQSVVYKLLSIGKKIIKNKSLRKFLKRFKPIKAYTEEVRRSSNDQAVVADFIANHEGGINIQLDYECKLFWCVAGEWIDLENHYEIVNNKIVNKNTNTVPACIHIPYTNKYNHLFLKMYALVMENSLQ
ncbi:MAG: hypothetical protein HN379_06405 [Desulfobacteraceae bacterium]|jgi:hypothetical protein|nr:hypothetical protein [Desulfobacteraceae bacterium]